MSKLIKWPLFILIGLLIIVGIKAPLLFRLPTLINTTRAKMFCSCYFVVGQTKKYCEKHVNKGYPMNPYKINENNKSVTFISLGSVTAFVTNERFGCQVKY